MASNQINEEVGQRTDQLLVSVETLPEHLRLVGMYPMVQHSGVVAEATLFTSIVRQKEEAVERIERAFRKKCPPEANMIIGVRVETVTAPVISDGNTRGINMMITYSGTPVVVEPIESGNDS